MSRPRTPYPSGRGGGSGDLRRGNLTEILRYVRDHGASSRQDVARGCGLGLSTMTDLVAELRRRGLVRELEAVRRPGAGRPTRPIALDGDRWFVLGVEIDVVQFSFTATAVGGRELWREQVPTHLLRSGPDGGYALLADALCAQLLRIPAGMTLVAVEVALPGHVGSDRGTVTWPPSLGWGGMPLQRMLYDTVYAAGWENFTIGLEQSGQLAALHAVREEIPLDPGAIGVYLGGVREITGGVVVDGQIFHGANGGAGDFGHTGVDPHGPVCPCGRRGCLESLLGPAVLLTRSGLVPAAEVEQIITFEPVQALQMLIGAARSGHPQVLEVLAGGGTALGAALDTIIGTLNPATVVLGGYLGLLQPFLQPTMDQRLSGRLSVAAFASTRIVALDELKPRVLLGAGLAGRDRCLADPLTLTHVL